MTEPVPPHVLASAARAQQRSFGSEVVALEGRPTLAASLLAERWTPPPAPPPIEVSDEAARAGYAIWVDTPGGEDDLDDWRAVGQTMFPHMLRDALLRAYHETGYLTERGVKDLYYAMAGQEWPDAV